MKLRNKLFSKAILAFLLTLAFTVINVQFSSAQLYIDSDVLLIQKNATLYIEGDLETAKSGSINPKVANWGTLAVEGEVDFHSSTDYHGQGSLCFTGSATQTISASFPLKKIDIQNNANVELSSDFNLQGELTLTNGHLVCGNYDLTIDDSVTITGGSSSSYIRINGTGRVKTEVGSSPVTLPIGRNPYLPITIDDGGGEEYSVGVSEGVYANPVNQTTLQTNNVVGETWTIQSSGSQSNVSVTLQWESAEEETGFSRSSSNLSFWEHGVSSVWDVGTLGSASGSGPYSLTRTVNFTSNLFYFGVGSSGSALPVELTYFNAQWVTSAPLSNPNTTPLNDPLGTVAERSRETDTERSRSARLTWQTATETNNSHFEVQRMTGSLSGPAGRSGGVEMNRGEMNDWQTIGTVAGQGTTLQTQDYEFVDHDLASASSIIYYRLKQVDFNGEFEYSVIRTLSVDDSEFDGATTFTIFPNPSNAPSIYADKMDSYRVLSVTGKVLKQFSNTTSIDVSDLATGTYIIQNTNGSTQLYMRN